MAKLAVEPGMALDEYFQGQVLSRRLFDTISEMIQEIGPVEIRVTKSQVAFVQRKAFAWVWMPGKYLHRKVAPLVLTLVLDHRDGSSRWKEIVEPAPGKFTHHLELNSVNDIDEQVRGWLVGAGLAGA